MKKLYTCMWRFTREEFKQNDTPKNLIHDLKGSLDE